MKIGVIGGFSGQGKKIVHFHKGNPNITFLFFEHDDKKHRYDDNLIITKELRDLLECEGVIIASPTKFHFVYLKFFIENNYHNYIFCEKPPVSDVLEAHYLKNIDIEKKQRILFGFNLRHSVYQTVLDKCAEYDLGKMRQISIWSGHGLGYKDSYENSWRNDSKSDKGGILENVGIHYLDWILNNYGVPQHEVCQLSINAPRGRAIDTVSYSAILKNSSSVNMYLSYATPFMEECKIIFENGIVIINKEKVRIFYPRDSYDLNGFFISPPLFKEYAAEYDLWTESQVKIMNYFYKVIMEKSIFPVDYFNGSLMSNEYVFDLIKKFKR